MTLSNQVASITAEGNGATTSWAFQFIIPTTASCHVSVYDTTVDPATLTTITASDFTVSGIGVTAGGVVNYPLSGSPLVSGQFLTIARVLPIVQETSIRNQGNFYPAAVEHGLDYLTMVCQQLQEQITAIEADIDNPLPPVLPEEFQVVGTLGELRAMILGSGSVVFVQGYTTAGDGGGGFFRITTTNPGADNGGTWIHLDAPGYYAVRQLNGIEITPLFFGATGDGVTDDSDAVLSAATWLTDIGGGTVLVDKPYCMAATYFPDMENLVFQGAGGKIISFLPVANPFAPLHFQASTNIQFRGVEIDGNYPAFSVTPTGSTINNICLVLDDDCTFFDIGDCYIHDGGCNNGGDFPGDAIYIRGTGNDTHDIRIHDNQFANNARWAVAVLCGSNITIENNTNTHDSGIPALGLFDIEYDAGVPLGTNITIRNNVSRGPSQITMSPPTSPGFRNVQIIGNSLDFAYPDTGTITGGSSYNGIVATYCDNLHVIANQVYNCPGDLYHVDHCSNFVFSNNSGLSGSATTSITGIYTTTSTAGVFMNNHIIVGTTTGDGMAMHYCTDVEVIGNYLKNPGNWALQSVNTGTSCSFINNTLVAGSGLACRIMDNPVIFVGNVSAQAGRLDANAHTVMNNAMTINTVGGNWPLSGGKYHLPDFGSARNLLSLAAMPNAGAWTQGDFVLNSSLSITTTKVLIGWARLTTGTASVTGTDWVTVYGTTT